MHLSVDEVRRIARLARLRLSAEEEKLFVSQLGEILGYIDQLKDFETVEPELGEPSSTLEREDVARPSLDRDTLLANAPERWAGFVLVPQVKVTRDG